MRLLIEIDNTDECNFPKITIGAIMKNTEMLRSVPGHLKPIIYATKIELKSYLL